MESVEAKLRHPFEKLIFISSVVLNVAIMVGAIVIATRDSDWLKAHPIIASRIKPIQRTAVGAIILLPGIVLLRNARRAFMRGNSIRISARQMPVVSGILERHCQRLGIAPPPELYFSQAAISDPAHAYSAWDHDYIVLRAEYMAPDVEETRDVVEFLLGRELGAIRLGHTKWWDELLVAYVMRIPLLKNPLLHVRTCSKDRYGAFLAPHGVRGLLILSSGRRMLKVLNLPECLDRMERHHGLWFRISEMTREIPDVSHRISALYRTGLFRLQDDVARFSPGARHVA